MSFRDWTSPYRRLQAFVGLAVLSAIVVLAVSAAVSIRDVREEDRLRQRRSSGNLTRFLFENTERLFLSAEASLRELVAVAPAKWRDERALRRLLQDNRPAVRGYFFSFLTDERGFLRVSTETALPKLDFSGFVEEARREHGLRLIVGGLDDSLGRSRRFHPVLLPVFSGEGAFLGLAGLALDPDASTRFFAGLSDNGHLRLNVRLKSGPILFRYPHREDLVGQDLRGRQKVYEMAEKFPSGSFVERSAIQGDEAFYSFQRSERYPFFVHIVENLDDLQAGWKLSAWGFGLMWLALTGSLGLLGWFLWGQIAHLESEEAARRRAEAALSAATRMNAVGRLARGVARDFNRLLVGMQAQAQWLARHYDGDPEGTESVRRLRKTLARAEGLVRQVEILGRDGESDVEGVDLLARIQDLRAFLRDHPPGAVELRVEISGSPWVRADAGAIDHILMSLVSRALQPLEGRPGTLHIALKTEGDEAVIAVESARPSVDAPLPEGEADAAFTEQTMSLPVVEKLVEESGGRLEIIERDGPGESAILRWPRMPSGDGPGTALEGRGRVLFVDREESLQTLVGDAFESLRIPLRCFIGSEPALEDLRRDPAGASAVIVDRESLEGDVNVFLEEVRLLNPRLPILLTDRRAQDLDQVPRGLTFLRKPYTSKDLIGALARAARGEPS